MVEVEERFDGERASSSLVEDLRLQFNSGRTKSYEWRVEQLKGLLKMIEEKREDIVDALYKDLSRPRQEAIPEIYLSESSISVILEELKDWMQAEKADTSMSMFTSTGEIVSEPLGVVLVLSTWNYPFMLAIDPLVGAIAAGNAVVLKPSEISPAISSLLAHLLKEYLDNSTIKVIEGGIPETSALLNQKWDKIFYTGSGPVGRIVLAAAAKHLTPVVLELGGKSPVVVDSNINLEVAVTRIVGGKWKSNNGQTCVAPDYIITTKDYAPMLVDALKCKLEESFGKDPLIALESTNDKARARIVNANHFARLIKLLDDDKVSDKIVYGGQRDQTRLDIVPTILLDVPTDSMIMQEEIFGPLLPIITVDKVEESFEFIRSRPKPLAAYLFTANRNLEQKFVNTVSAGGIVINDTNIHVSIHTLPFGGVGESGYGSYHGKLSFDVFSHKKAVLYRTLDTDS